MWKFADDFLRRWGHQNHWLEIDLPMETCSFVSISHPRSLPRSLAPPLTLSLALTFSLVGFVPILLIFVMVRLSSFLFFFSRSLSPSIVTQFSLRHFPFSFPLCTLFLESVNILQSMIISAIITSDFNNFSIRGCRWCTRRFYSERRNPNTRACF